MNDKEFPLTDLEEGSEKELSIQNQVRCSITSANMYRVVQHNFAFLLVENSQQICVPLILDMQGEIVVLYLTYREVKKVLEL